MGRVRHGSGAGRKQEHQEPPNPGRILKLASKPGLGERPPAQLPVPVGLLHLRDGKPRFGPGVRARWAEGGGGGRRAPP